MIEIFSAVAGRTSTRANQEAVDFMVASRPRWFSQLTKLPNWDASSNRLTLYRGNIDCPAILLRKALRDLAPLCETDLNPLCYTTEKGVALGFARKGHINGSVYSIRVSLDSVLFVDLDGHYREGGLEREKEVVVWHKSPLTIEPGDVIDSMVPPQAPTPRNRSARAEWEQEKQRLEDKEKHLMSS